jgi:light-harvesting complex 1 beta chain
MNPLTGGSIRHEPRGDSFAFQCIFCLSFATLLVVAVVAQMLLLPWRSWLPGAEGGKTLLGGVRSAVYTLMSHLV